MRVFSSRSFAVSFAAPTVSTVLTALMLGMPAAASAQVGHRPESSPYEDFKIGQTVSIMAGWLAVKGDPAGVAPKSTAIGQLRYDLGIGGPASLFVRYMLAPTDRTVLLPSNPRATRVMGTQSATTHLMDLGFDISLTGRKTWHHLMPSLNSGVGIVSNFASADTGYYRFGTKFAFTLGGSLRFLPSRGPQIRVDLTRALWKYQYPDNYFVKASDTTSVLTNTRQRSAWRNNFGVSAGVSIPVFR